MIAEGLLMFAWSVFKTWELPIQRRGTVATETMPQAERPTTVVPTQVATE